MGIHIDISKDRIEVFCRQNHIGNFAFFGSVLRSDFRPDSDIDVLIEFEDGQEPSLLDLVRMENELSELFGQKVDFIILNKPHV